MLSKLASNLQFQQCGRWYPIHPYHAKAIGKKGNAIYWYCICNCGKTGLVDSSELKLGRSKSCGCLAKQLTGERSKQKTANNNSNFRHGCSTQNGKPIRTIEYKTWASMKERCFIPSVRGYKYWGGRGITVCERWLGKNGFINFLADMGKKPKGLTLDRIDHEGNYEPGNCRWATYSEQNKNRCKFKRKK